MTLFLSTVKDSTRRLNLFAEGAMLDADMEISVPKTEVMHARSKIQALLSPVNRKEVHVGDEAEWDSQTPVRTRDDCDDAFPTASGLSLHQQDLCGEARRLPFHN